MNFNYKDESTTPARSGNSTAGRSLDGLTPICESFEMETFLSDWQATELQRQEDADRREIRRVSALHDGGTSFESWLADLDAKSDPATNDAFDAILAGESAVTEDTAPVADRSSPKDSGHQSCSAPFLKRNGGAFEVVWFACRSRKCPNCSDRWRDQKIVDLGAIVDRLSGSDLDAPTVALNVGMIREDEWRTTSTRIRRHGAGSFTVPMDDDARLVITDDADFGSPRPAETAIETAMAALDELSSRPGEKRHVRFSKQWKDLADAGKPAEAEKDESVQWLGIATKADNLAKVKSAAKRAGGNAAPVASLDEDLDDLGSYTVRAKVPEQTEWKFLQIIGFKSFAQIAEERAERKAMLAYEIRERESQRRRRDRTCELVAA